VKRNKTDNRDLRHIKVLLIVCVVILLAMLLALSALLIVPRFESRNNQSFGSRSDEKFYLIDDFRNFSLNIQHWEPHGSTVTPSLQGLVIHATEGYWDEAKNQAGISSMFPLAASTKVRVRLSNTDIQNVAGIYWGILGNTPDFPYPVDGLSLQFNNGISGRLNVYQWLDSANIDLQTGPSILPNEYYWGEFYYAHGVSYLNVYSDNDGRAADLIYSFSEPRPSSWSDTTPVGLRITDNHQFSPEGAVILAKIEANRPLR
jgi:hypothetical protein